MWSIAIYEGDSPFNLKPLKRNPVLTKDDVTDMSAEFVADPFMIKRESTWYMFFEVLNADTQRGAIGVATSDEGIDWTYKQIVLEEPFHLSYPYVFEWRDEYYMIPETLNAGAVCLYKAGDFPSRWSCIARLIEGRCADPSIFRFNDLWWLFVCPTPYLHDTLRLYFASELTGPWTEHPKSPIITGDKCRARPAGRILELNDRPIRFAQDCARQYGHGVRAFEISTLTRTDYAEIENGRNPILTASGSGWNASGMHHIDAHKLSNGKWLACVDGFSS